MSCYGREILPNLPTYSTGDPSNPKLEASFKRLTLVCWFLGKNGKLWKTERENAYTLNSKECLHTLG